MSDISKKDMILSYAESLSVVFDGAAKMANTLNLPHGAQLNELADMAKQARAAVSDAIHGNDSNSQIFQVVCQQYRGVGLKTSRLFDDFSTGVSIEEFAAKAEQGLSRLMKDQLDSALENMWPLAKQLQLGQ